MDNLRTRRENMIFSVSVDANSIRPGVPIDVSIDVTSLTDDLYILYAGSSSISMLTLLYRMAPNDYRGSFVASTSALTNLITIDRDGITLWGNPLSLNSFRIFKLNIR